MPVAQSRMIAMKCVVCQAQYTVRRTRSAPRVTCSTGCRSTLAVRSGAGQNKREELIPVDEIWRRAEFIRLNGIGSSEQWW